MKLPSYRNRIVIFGAAFAVALSVAPISHAQYGGSGGQQQPPPSLQPAKPGAQQEQKPAAQAPVDPEEEKAYKAFTDVKPDAFDQQIQALQSIQSDRRRGRHVGLKGILLNTQQCPQIFGRRIREQAGGRCIHRRTGSLLKPRTKAERTRVGSPTTSMRSNRFRISSQSIFSCNSARRLPTQR